MENVVAFNSELSSLYETKPPISKAKMAAITKSAMRAIKFYKHVVQSVEKFILKCRPEYKVPGLYVIDSIVRQSRHQFGSEKDVFAPRFARNIKETFANLFSCPAEDKSRIIRVLNLWQKNNVFAPDLIQPLFDLADPNNPIYQTLNSNILSGTAGGIGNVGLPSGSAVSLNLCDISSTSNGLNTSISGLDLNISGNSGLGPGADDKMLSGLPDLSNNNLKQLLNDPNVLLQLKTLQNLQKFKQDDKYKMKEEVFEKHLQNVLKASGGAGQTLGMSIQDANDFNQKDVEFISEEQKIEVINLDGNDSRSPSPDDRDRYKRRRSSRSRSRSRDRAGRRRGISGRSRSRSRSRSPRSQRRRNSRERDRDRNERNKEKDRERRKKGLPDIKKEHLSVCSTTLWVGHLSKLVYQEELSDTFGEFGDIVSIDQIVPRGCAFIVMNRRQDAHKAMQSLKNCKLQGRTITISWAAGKGVKSKEWKDFWDLDLGVTYIPWHKLDDKTDFDSLEEGGMFDEDSMPGWIKDKVNQKKLNKEKSHDDGSMVTPIPPPLTSVPPPVVPPPQTANMIYGIDTTQPPPGPPPGGPPPPLMQMVPGQYPMAPPMGGPPRMLAPMAMQLSGIPMPPSMVPGMAPPPHPMMIPPGMMPPGFPPMTGPGGPMGPPPMGLPPGPGQYPPSGPSTSSSTANFNTGPNTQGNDDQMDIEMDEDDGSVSSSSGQHQSSSGHLIQQHPPLSFNQPPPMMFSGGSGTITANNNMVQNINDSNRNRSGSSSRWSGGRSDDENGDVSRWRENGIGPSNFNGRNNSLVGGNNLNNGGQMAPNDFMNALLSAALDFSDRGGAQRGGGGPRQPGPINGNEFFPNMPQNRFSQPASLMQMRIPPPNQFSGGPRMGCPPMFVRGQGGQGNGRQQNPGFFNSRNPFDRDGNRGVGVRGNVRGGRGGGRGGPNNWSDEEEETNPFKRRGGGGNRYRDRDGSDDWHGNRDRDRNSRGRGNRYDRNAAVDRGDRSERSDRNNRNDRDRDRGERNDRGDHRSDRERDSRESVDRENSEEVNNDSGGPIKSNTNSNENILANSDSVIQPVVNNDKNDHTNWNNDLNKISEILQNESENSIQEHDIEIRNDTQTIIETKDQISNTEGDYMKQTNNAPVLLYDDELPQPQSIVESITRCSPPIDDQQHICPPSSINESNDKTSMGENIAYNSAENSNATATENEAA